MEAGQLMPKLALDFFLLAPSCNLQPLVCGAVVFEPVGSPANHCDIPFRVALLRDELVQAWAVRFAATSS